MFRMKEGGIRKGTKVGINFKKFQDDSAGIKTNDSLLKEKRLQQYISAISLSRFFLTSRYISLYAFKVYLLKLTPKAAPIKYVASLSIAISAQMVSITFQRA